MVFTQREFDDALLGILQTARNEGRKSCRVISRDLHRQVVGGAQPNRMPMACNAMWRLWEIQGANQESIINTTPSGKSSTIEIEYSAAVEMAHSPAKSSAKNIAKVEKAPISRLVKRRLSSLDEAKGFMAENRPRYAGMAAGIVIENYLKSECHKHRIKFSFRKANIRNCSRALRRKGVIDETTQKEIEWINKIRNKCAHMDDEGIEASEIQDMINAVARIIN